MVKIIDIEEFRKNRKGDKKKTRSKKKKRYHTSHREEDDRDCVISVNSITDEMLSRGPFDNQE